LSHFYISYMWHWLTNRKLSAGRDSTFHNLHFLGHSSNLSPVALTYGNHMEFIWLVYPYGCHMESIFQMVVNLPHCNHIYTTYKMYCCGMQKIVKYSIIYCTSHSLWLIMAMFNAIQESFPQYHNKNYALFGMHLLIYCEFARFSFSFSVVVSIEVIKNTTVTVCQTQK